MSGSGNAELLEKIARHASVVVLSGVHEPIAQYTALRLARLHRPNDGIMTGYEALLLRESSVWRQVPSEANAPVQLRQVQFGFHLDGGSVEAGREYCSGVGR
jgi:hypothetical protein